MLVLPITTLLVTAVTMTPVVAASTVYKCAGATNAVVYQDIPCAAGKELRNFTNDPPALSVIPGTPVPGAKREAVAAPRAERIATGAKRTRTNDSNASERRFIAVGMTAAEVIQRIGRPDVNANGPRGKGQHWSYLPKAGDPQTMTTLTLVSGKVTDIERKVMR
ncbi:MAG: hypothetical protein ABI537_11225 [Casimicrobiaceae bacterium]